MTAETLARAIRAKEIPGDALVSRSHEGWQRATEVAEIVDVIGALSASELRVVAGGFTSTRLGTPEFGATVMMAPRHQKGS